MRLCKRLAFLTIFLSAQSILSANADDWLHRKIKIGLMTELSGEYAANGADCRRGYELVASSVKSDDGVEFIFADSKGEAKTGITEFHRLVDVGMVDLVVTNRSQVGMALTPLLEKNKTPLLGVVGHQDFLRASPYSFRFWPSTELESEALAKEAIRRNLKTAAIASFEDEWGISFREGFVSEYKQLGGQVLFDEIVPNDLSDFKTVIAKIRQLSPKTVIVNLGLSQAGTFIRQLREQGLKQELLGSYFVRTKEVIEQAGVAAMEGLILVELNLDKPKFRDKLKEIFGDEVEVTAITYTCYTAAATALHTVELAKQQKGNSLMSILKNLRQVPLMDEMISLRDREAQYDLQYKVIRQGKVVDARS